MIRVLLVEDQGLLRGALAALLDLEDDLEVVAQAADGLEALAAARHARPDVAVVDIEIPAPDGFVVTAELVGADLGCRVLIVTTYERPGYLRRAMDAGAAGFLLKDTPVAELAEAIRTVHAGGRVVDHQLAVRALTEGENPLTTREREILTAAREHRNAGGLARQLHLSEGTVRNHLSAAIRKVGARTRAEAVDIATTKGWL